MCKHTSEKAALILLKYDTMKRIQYDAFLHIIVTVALGFLHQCGVG